MGYDMAQGTLVRWLKQEGDQVQRGELIAEIETDKAVVTIEAPASGLLRKTLAAAGTTVPVLQAIAIIGTAEEDITSLVSGAPAPSSAAVAPPPAPPAPAAATSSAGVEVKASPVARRLAEEKGIDLRLLKGTGPGGRITREDVEAHLARGQAAPAPVLAPPEAPAPTAVVRVELSRMRQAIARNTVQSKPGVPHFYVTVEVDMTSALALRSQVNESQQRVRVTINDVVLRAAVLALAQYPNLNASFRDTYLEVHPYIHLGVAIAREGGLVVPAIVNAQEKSLLELAAASKDLAERVQTGRLRQEEYNGTFNTSNLGMFGVDEFSAIIMPPQAAVLAIAAVKPQPVVADGQVVVRQMMKLTVSVDHRASDGVEGARFMQELKRLLEQPVSLLL
jgi:pyruvate dehydrogenase E2 component (dihydrolipoamide acetyltransferase)